MSLAIFDYINTILLPEYCVICSKSGHYICQKCLKLRFTVNFRTTCHVCGGNSYTGRLHKECEDSTNLDKLYYFCEYNAAAKKLIESVKYGGNYAIIKELALHMSRYLLFTHMPKDFVITSVPSHWHKFNQRGFNQSDLLAKQIAKDLGVEYKILLKKTQNTKKQAGTSKNSRNTNLRNTFIPKEEDVTQNVMIIDDVHTTGATLNECAGILKKMGVKMIYGYTFSKSMKYSPVESKP